MDPTTQTTSVPETSPAAPSLEDALQAAPQEVEAPSQDGEFDPPVDTLGSQIARTDARLVAWRDESVRRRAEYDEQVAREQAVVDRKRRRMMAMGVVVGGSALAAVAVVGVGLAIVFRPVAPTEPADRGVRRPGPAVVAEAPVIAPVVVAPVVAPVVVEPPVVAAVAPPAPAVVPGLAIEEGSVRVWSDKKHVWVAFRAEDPGALRLHWKDAVGNSVLEPMRCGSADCRAGRSHSRIAGALAAGAAPGTWTIEACGTAGCAEVGTFAAVAPPVARLQRER